MFWNIFVTISSDNSKTLLSILLIAFNGQSELEHFLEWFLNTEIHKSSLESTDDDFYKYFSSSWAWLGLAVWDKIFLQSQCWAEGMAARYKTFLLSECLAGGQWRGEGGTDQYKTFLLNSYPNTEYELFPQHDQNFLLTVTKKWKN